MAFVPYYVLILFFLITVDYFLAFEINKREGNKRTAFLLLSVVANLGTLFFFKYFNFFSENAALLMEFLHFNYSPTLFNILLPLGLSFHIFQSLSYVIEVYRKKYTPEKSYITYATYVMFFPQLVAGPIERPQNLLPQFSVHRAFDPILARRGLERMLWGFFKKLVIADQISRIIVSLYNNLPADTVVLIIIAILFTYQLYSDFSGYSDIAVGSAMLFGFTLTENFNRPFAAQTIGEFWRRWHMSLSNWLRDYLYYPMVLSIKRPSKLKLYMCTLVTFTLIGLWHGANWTYVVFGAIHGIYLVVENIFEKGGRSLVQNLGLIRFPRMLSFVNVIKVFTLVSISLIFFRAENLEKGWWIFTNLFSVPSFDFILGQAVSNPTYSGLKVIFIPTVLAIIFMEIVQYYQTKHATLYLFETKSRLVRYVWYYFLTFSIIVLGFFGEQAFIYFQF